MKEYKKRCDEKVKYSLSIGDTNGSNIIIGILNDGVYFLKNSPISWLSIKTGIGYDLSGNYNSIQAACDNFIENGGRIITEESKSISDCESIRDVLLNAL